MPTASRLLLFSILGIAIGGTHALAETAAPTAVNIVPGSAPPAPASAPAPVPPGAAAAAISRPAVATDSPAPPAAAVPAPEAATATAEAPPQPDDNATLYCRAIANLAADARYARQVDALTALEKEIDDRLAKLEQKRGEYEEWVKRREDFMAKADEAVVAIYSQMRPDAASQQIAAMDEESAAAILSKLSPRTASAILNEMDAPSAAHLTNVMAGLPAEVKKVVKN